MGSRNLIVSNLSYVDILEAPYVLSGAPHKIIPLAAKVSGEERGYDLYLSLDGSTYNRLDKFDYFQPHGILFENYTSNTFTIDDDVGFIVRFTYGADLIESITRSEMLAGYNMALLGSEIISFQHFIPITENIAKILGVYRARFDTTKVFHSRGEHFWFLDKDCFSVLNEESILRGAVRYFKFVPYTQMASASITSAKVIKKTFTGRSMTPYQVLNLKANGGGVHPTYSQDIILTWSPRVRKQGAGLGIAYSTDDALEVIDYPPSWEGYFKVQVYVNGSDVRTVTGIDALTWTYSEDMNISDNGTLAEEITFYLSNYIEDSGYVYESASASITVRRTSS